MAGELIVKGWIGTSTTYKEVKTPQISYEPQEIRGGLDVVMTKRLHRELTCFSKHVDTILKTLDTFNATIAVNIIDDVSGTLVSKSYGGGWNLTLIDTDEAKRPFSKIMLRYEKTVPVAFEFNLPTDLDITCIGGICTISYDGTILETINSEKGVTTSGLTIQVTGGMTEKKLNMFSGRSEQLDPDSTALTSTYSNQWTITYYEIDVVLSLLVDGVVFETFKIATTDYSDLTETVYTSVISTKHINPASETTERSGETDIIRIAPAIEQSLKWDTSESGHIKLIFWDQVIRDWDVSAL